MPKRGFALGVAIWATAIAYSSPASATCPVPNALTNGQVADATQVMDNFNALGNCSVATTGSPANGSLSVFSGTKTIGTGDLSGDVTTSGSTATTLAPTGVTPGTYINPNITVDAKGRVTALANGGSGGGGDGGSPYEAPPVSEPSVADFTWNNQGSATATDAAGGGILMSSATVGLSLRMLEKDTPAVPFSVYANVRTLYAIRNTSNQLGIGFRNSSNGRIIFFCINPGNSTELNIMAQRWTNVTTFTANVFVNKIWTEVNWLRVDIDESGFTFFASANGKDWVNIGTEPFGSFLTTAGGELDKYGIVLQNNANPFHAWFPSFGLVAP